MAEERIQRRLAAILAADVVSYTRLMDADEAGTLARLKTLRSEVFDPKTEEFGGRIFKNTGDGALAEFSSTVDAVQCAVEIQRALARRNAEAREDQQLIMRIGISQGDVIVEGEDLFGNGVNVAARMEGLAEPGGICVSGNVQEHIGKSLDVGLEDLGEQTVKNIDRPVRCYRVHIEPDDTTEASSPPLPDKPSIAVLPFDNLSGDPEQEYFSEGITEDIITALSRIRWFFVVARNSSFSYKGTSPDIRKVATELGVRYVLEGSVRKAGNRVRISAQLIDGSTGNHLWAERYDREIEDIFALQDEITQTVVGAIEPEMAEAEQKIAKAKRPDNLNAWDVYQQGMYFFNLRTEEACLRAQRLFENAVEMDDTFVSAYSGLALSHHVIVSQGWSDAPEEDREKSRIAARRAIELDPEDTSACGILGATLVHIGQFDEAKSVLKKAIELNPSNAFAHLWLGTLYLQQSDTKLALRHLELALRLSPHDPWIGQIFGRIAHAHLNLGEYEQAVNYAKKSIHYPTSGFRQHAVLVSALSLQGRVDEAEQARKELMRRWPNFSCSWYEAVAPKGSGYSEIVNGLRMAGIPDE